MKNSRILIADTETSGLEFGAEIIELAYLEVTPELEVISKFEQRYKPTRPISPAASAAHGLVIEDLEGCPPPSEIPCLTDIFMIAHNAHFDMRMLERFWDFSSAGHLCTCRAAQQLYPECPDHKLQTLKYYLGLGRDHAAHSAMGDISLLLELLQRMLSDSGLGLEDFVKEAMAPIKYEVMWFGKHKGTPMVNLPRSYVTWLRTLDDPYKDLELSLEGC